MVKKLKNKFVLVTMVLMVTVFGGFIIITTIYDNYWKEIEISEMLEWIAQSGVFHTKNMDSSSEAFIMDISDYDKPIIGIVMDMDGKILSQQTIGADYDVEIPDEILNRMCTERRSKYKIDKYYYSYSRINDNLILLVIMDSSISKNEAKRMIGTGFLGLMGVGVLYATVVLLSGFVTSPARQSLLKEKQFISDASHELKTPLGAICINAEALAMDSPDNIHLKNIISESSRMGRLVERLLVLARLDEQENVIHSKISLSELFEEMSLTFESCAFEKEINYNYDIEPDIMINGDADEIRQLFAILIDNAIKNTPENGTIGLSCKILGKRKKISVTNTGEGISPEVLPHIFERFYTGNASRNNGSFGLGLSIAKAIVQRHNGKISVTSVSGEKTVFEIVF